MRKIRYVELAVVLLPFFLLTPANASGDDVFPARASARLDAVRTALDRYEAGSASNAPAEVPRDTAAVFSPRDTGDDRPVDESAQEAWLENTAGRRKARAVKNALNQVEFGTELYAYSYREPGIMKDRGYLYGLFATYTRRLKDNSEIKTLRDAWEDPVKATLFRFDGRLARGQVDYDSDATGSIDAIDYYSFELRGVMGYDFPVNPSLKVTPFFGVGLRYLLDDGGGRTSSTGNWAYDRESRYFYLPLGFDLAQQLEHDWSITLSCEYDFFIDGRQKSHLEDGGATLYSATTGQNYVPDTLENDQDEGFGLRASLRLLRTMDRWNFYVEPFVRYWSLKDSQLGQETSNSGTQLWYYDQAYQHPVYLYEPENNTTEYGMRIGLQY